MEAKPSSSTSLRLRMEEQLTCPVCLDLYTNPKTLPCLHSFCEACIERFPRDKEGETYYLSCPTCRHRTELPEGGAGAFPVAFTLNNLKEIYSLMKDPTDQQCKDHEKPLELFCETCDKLICAHCTIDHKQHEYNLVTDSYTKHCQQLKEYLPPVKRKVETLKNVTFLLAERKKEIRERGEGVLEEIHEMVEEMMNVLRESERKLSEEAKRVTDAKLEVLSGQAELAQIRLSFLESIEDYVEQSVKTDTPQQVLSSKKQMMERMSEVTTQINVEELEPKEKADFALSKDIKSLHHIGDIISGPTALQQCKVKKIGHLELLPEEKKVSFSLSMEAPNSSLASVPVSSLKCSLVPVGKGDEPIDTTVTTTSTHPGVYRIHCNPSASGTHTVKVQVYDVELGDTSLVIPFNPYLDNITPVRTITELNRPWGVAVSDDGHVIVTEWDSGRVIILNKENNFVESVGFRSPRGVAITPDNFILVSDNHRIGKISMDGDCIASVGEEGSGPLQFNYPAGIAISPITGQVYIADWDNHRIQVLNPEDLTFSHSFGSKGSANGQFQYPCDIAIDSRGLVYVTDANNHRIQNFSPDGRFVAQFGNDLSDIRCPLGITIDRAHGLVYVTEYGKEIVPQSLSEKMHTYLSLYRTDNTSPVERLLVFTTDGRLIWCMTPFINPRGLTLDSNGLLYVCSNDVLIF